MGGFEAIGSDAEDGEEEDIGVEAEGEEAAHPLLVEAEVSMLAAMKPERMVPLRLGTS
jgi:hypothetical protein